MGYIGQAPTKVPLTSADITDGTIALADMAANSIDSDQYVDASIDLAHIATNQIDETLMKDALIGDFSDVTVTAADTFLYGDATDSGNTKKDTVQGILDLAGGGGPTVTTEQVTTSGTEFVFGSIPAGTNTIIINFANIGIDDADHYRVQIGDAGGIETSGYVTETSQFQAAVPINTITSSTLGFYIRGGNGDFSGHMILTLVDDDAFTWVSSHAGRLATTKTTVGGGYKSLSAELTQLQVDTPGSGSFDSGTVNIFYF